MELGISPTHILDAVAVEPVEDAVEAQSPEVLCLASVPALCPVPEELQPVSPDRDTIRRQASYIQAEPSSTSPASTQSASIFPASKLWTQLHQSVLTLTRRGQDCQVEVRWYHSNGFTPVLTWGSETAPVVDLTPLRLLAEIVRLMQE